MKAQIVKKPILSISMIVKNEGKKLRRCLESIQKLMDKIDCQLIITDTGSTDDTVEIAKEFASIVNHFEWCDDYSAARNCGIELATGEWYGYLDADEWYSDELIANIADFFKKGEYKNYSSAFTVHRNYHDKDCYEYYDVKLLRFVALNDDTRFSRKIHETLNYSLPSIMIKGFIFHDGYFFETKEEHDAKINKLNENVERQLATNFDDLDLLVSYSSSVTNPERKEVVLRRILDFAIQENSVNLYNSIYYKLLNFYFKQERYSTCLDTAQEYIDEMLAKGYPLSIDGYNALAQIYLHEKMYALAIKNIDLYLNAVKLYDATQGQTYTIELMTIGNKSRERFIITAATLLIPHNVKTALKYYALYDFEKGELSMDMFKNFLMGYKCTPEKEILFALIDTMSCMKDLNARHSLQSMLCIFLMCNINKDIYFNHLADYKKNNLLVSSFLWLHSVKLTGKALPAVRSIEQLIDKDAIAPYIATLMGMQVNVYPDVLAMLDRKQIADATDIMINLGEYLCHLVYSNINYAQKATELKELMFYIPLLDTVFGTLAKEDVAQRRLIASTIIDCIYRFAKSYYNSLLVAAEPELLPEAHRFALQVRSVDKACNPSEYIATLRSAINNTPSMKEIAQLLLEDFEKEVENGKVTPKTEFELLAETVKCNAKAFISAGNVNDAAAVLTQLKSLVADDVEIDNLLLMCKHKKTAPKT